MGKSIIFVGRTNLNKNSDNQSMYKSDYGHYLKLDRYQFYRDLCEACRTCPGKKKRNNKISRLHSKYQGYSCSERTMEKVFTAYLECFGRPMGQLEYRKKMVELPDFLERNKVDRRIIKRIKVIEKLEPVIEKKQVKKNKVTTEKPTILTDKNKSIIQSHVVLPKVTKVEQKTRNRNFYKMLHEYLMESISNPQAIMISELVNNCRLFNRDAKYIDGMKQVYKDAKKNNLSLLESCTKNNFVMYKKDRSGLNNFFKKSK